MNLYQEENQQLFDEHRRNSYKRKLLIEQDLPFAIQREQLSVAVNISIRQFMQRSFVEVVKQAIFETRIQPECLILEITESIAMNVESTLPIFGSNDYFLGA
ncbi:hypothetical protein [Paenibacillus sp. sgz302251]|uniref:hypothetical protein n=1 Tax=Paenibacillus sp. sgz302251 TaxID=3414493 RepID=UPI003C7C403B